MTTAVEVVRDSAGRVTVGAATLNPTGRNQHSSPGHLVKRHLDVAIELELAKRPNCYAGYAKRFADAVEDPEAHLPLLYLNKSRIETVSPGDDADPGGDADLAEIASADQLLRLAEGARRAIPADTRLALSAVCESPGRTSEAD